MIIYIDEKYQCHPYQNEEKTWREFDVSKLNGCCETFIKGHNYIPAGEELILDDGITILRGEQLYPNTSWETLLAAQKEYLIYLERQNEAQQALEILLNGEK